MGQGDAGEDKNCAGDLGKGEGLAEEEHGEKGREGYLGEQADRGDGGGEMAERIGEGEIATELGEEAETEEGCPSAGVGHAQRDSQSEIDEQQCQRA